jgi:hypothetical protein
MPEHYFELRNQKTGEIVLRVIAGICHLIELQAILDRG